MMRRLFCPLVTFLLVGFSLARAQTVSAVVVDMDSKAALPFASISIVGTSNGVYADESGNFSLHYRQDNILTVSHIGYSTVKILAKNCPDTIALHQVITKLSPVQVFSNGVRKRKSMKLGVDENNFRFFFTGWLSYATRIKNSKSLEGVIASAKFRISALRNHEKPKARIRIRVYSVDKNTGLPAEDLLRENLNIDHDSHEKYVEVDLRDYNIAFPHEGLYVGIDILGYIDNDGAAIPYSHKEIAKHISIPMGEGRESMTVYRQFNTPWNFVFSPGRSGEFGIRNAGFSIIVEY
jgi:hypothetical protein